MDALTHLAPLLAGPLADGGAGVTAARLRGAPAWLRLGARPRPPPPLCGLRRPPVLLDPDEADVDARLAPPGARLRGGARDAIGAPACEAAL